MLIANRFLWRYRNHWGRRAFVSRTEESLFRAAYRDAGLHPAAACDPQSQGAIGELAA